MTDGLWLNYHYEGSKQCLRILLVPFITSVSWVILRKLLIECIYKAPPRSNTDIQKSYKSKEQSKIMHTVASIFLASFCLLAFIVITMYSYWFDVFLTKFSSYI